ncbi:glycosyltransferase family 9 protein [Paraburkholderia diazotrophica]|nr:glycosyltransferase family 9 protein [Paraburkholderia diazotrophica]
MRTIDGRRREHGLPGCRPPIHNTKGSIAMGWKGSLAEVPLWFAGRLGPQPARSRNDAPRSILVLRPNDLGDLLTTTPIFEALRRRFPDARLVAGIGRWGRAIVENNPFVDEVLELDAPWHNKVVPDQSLGAALRFIRDCAQVRAARERGGFDVGIDVVGSHFGLLLMLRLGVRYRIGVRGYRGGWSGCHGHIRFSPMVHVSRAALAQAELLGAHDLPEARPQLYLTDFERAQAAHVWRSGAVAGRRPVRLLVGCAAGLPDKSWAPEALGEALGRVSRALAQAGGSDIVIVGGAAEKSCAQTVIEHSGAAAGIRSLAGQTPLRTTFALAEQADVVITNSSMLLHAAAAFRRPTVAVLGGTLGDARGHDSVWGYCAPYCSVGPENGKPYGRISGWPSIERVVQTILDKIAGHAVSAGPDRLSIGLN